MKGYQGGYNMGMNYGQGGPQGQGLGPGQSGGYRGQGYGGRDPDDRGDRGGQDDYGYGGGPGTRGHSGASYGGFGGHGYARGEGSWRRAAGNPGRARNTRTGSLTGSRTAGLITTIAARAITGDSE